MAKYVDAFIAWIYLITKNIQEWIDDGDTAICPSCGIDSVIGSASSYPITPEFLTAMQKFWFEAFHLGRIWRK